MEILLSDKYSMIENQSGRTFEELLGELRRLRGEIKNFKDVQEENNRLDAEYFHIKKMERKSGHIVIANTLSNNPQLLFIIFGWFFIVPILKSKSTIKVKAKPMKK